MTRIAVARASRVSFWGMVVLASLASGCSCAAEIDPGNQLYDARVDDDAATHDDGAARRDSAVSDGASEDDGSSARDDGAVDDGSSGDADGAVVDDGATIDDASDDMDGAIFDDGSSSDVDAGVDLPHVIINEIVAYPNNDWNHSDGLATAFSGEPGIGFVSSLDQFIELYNAGPNTVNLTGWTLSIVDSSPSLTRLGRGEAVIVTTPGSSLSALQPGHYLVIGNPAGVASTDGYYILRNADSAVIDSVEVGGLTPERDFRGNGVGNGAPDATWNGFARGTYDEAIARVYGSEDTGNDGADFDRMPGTPLAPNIIEPPPVESDPPFVVDYVVGTIAVTDMVWVALDEPVDPASTEGSITVLVGGIPRSLDLHTFMDGDRVIVINPTGRLPFDATVEVIVEGSTGGVTDRAGNPLVRDFSFTFRTEAAPVEPSPVVINELCITPLQDWNEEDGGDGIPFSTVPGIGHVDSDDEWIEVLNVSAGESDLSRYRIVAYNGFNLYGPVRSTTLFASDLIVLQLFGEGDGLENVAEGDRLVIGNPRSSLSPAMYIELRDGAGRLVDYVEIGGNTLLTDRGGDGLFNGAPGPNLDGTSMDLDHEVVARIPDGFDTGSDVDDWMHAPATLGASNGM